MIKFILTNLLQLIINCTNTKHLIALESTTKLSLTITPLIFIFDKLFNWSIKNQDYILVVLGAILIDYIFGTIKHAKEGTFSLKGNALGLVTKLGLATAGGFLFEGLNVLTQDSDFIVSSLKIITRVIVFLYPALSAWENIHIVSGGKFPPKSWLDNLNSFLETLNINKLNPKNKKDEENN